VTFLLVEYPFLELRSWWERRGRAAEARGRASENDVGAVVLPPGVSPVPTAALVVGQPLAPIAGPPSP
jgi:hypothetical protein